MQSNPQPAGRLPDERLPPERLDAFRAHLQSRGLAATTVKAYVFAVGSWSAGGMQSTKRGTASVLRGALRAWSAWTGEKVPEVVLPPEARPAPPAAAPSLDALSAYHTAVECCDDPVARAALHVLPEAGLRLGTLLRARRSGKAPWRTSHWLEGYEEFLAEGPWLFPGPDGKPARPDSVQRYLRLVRGAHAWTADDVRRGRL